MYNQDYLKKIFFTLMGAAVAIPTIAMGYYSLYLFVTAVGN